MNKKSFWGLFSILLFVGIHDVGAQNSIKPKIKVQKRTLLNQFESDYVLSVSERIALKQSRIAHQYRTKKIWDTMQLSDRKRKRLIKELKRNPFSERIIETIAPEVRPEKRSKEN
jgi:hypothetical protein